MGFLETLGRSGFNPAGAISQGLSIRNALDQRRQRDEQQQRLKAENAELIKPRSKAELAPFLASFDDPGKEQQIQFMEDAKVFDVNGNFNNKRLRDYFSSVGQGEALFSATAKAALRTRNAELQGLIDQRQKTLEGGKFLPGSPELQSLDNQIAQARLQVTQAATSSTAHAAKLSLRANSPVPNRAIGDFLNVLESGELPNAEQGRYFESPAFSDLSRDFVRDGGVPPERLQAFRQSLVETSIDPELQEEAQRRLDSQRAGTEEVRKGNTRNSSAFSKVDLSDRRRTSTIESIRAFDSNLASTGKQDPDLLVHDPAKPRGTGAVNTERLFLPDGKGKFTVSQRDPRSGEITPSLREGKVVTLTEDQVLTSVGKRTRSIVNEFKRNLGRELGRGLGKEVTDLKVRGNVARASKKIIASGKFLLDQGIFTGPTAKIEVTFNKFLDRTGFEIDGKKVANTEAFAGLMAAQVGKILGSGVFGAGVAISDADREFAANMAAGNIALSEESLRELLDINDRLADTEIFLANEAIKKAERAFFQNNPFELLPVQDVLPDITSDNKPVEQTPEVLQEQGSQLKIEDRVLQLMSGDNPLSEDQAISQALQEESNVNAN